jgi:hypothetical protein
MVTSLFKLLYDVKLCNSKMRVLDVITLLFGDQLGRHMVAHSQTLATYLPTLWASCDDSPQYGMLRTAIVRSLVKLVEALGSESVHLLPLLCPVIHQSIDTAQEHHIYLLEDGLSLWHTTLQHTPVMTDEFMQLFRFVLPLLERGDQSVRNCIQIIESYVLLGGVAFLQGYGAALAQVLATLVTAMPPDGIDVMSRLCDTIIVAFPSDGCTLLAAVLSWMLEYLAKQFGEGTLFRPGAMMMVLSRVLLVNAPAFITICQQTSVKLGGDIWNPFFDLWIDKFETVSNPIEGKVVVLALANTLAHPHLQPYVEPRFALILNTIVSGMHQYHMQGGEFLPVDLMVQFQNTEELHDSEFTTDSEPARRRKLSAQDAVSVVNTRQFVEKQLRALEAGKGAAAFARMMATVDPTIVAQFQAFFPAP